MARYRIYYLRESQRQHFRQAPPAPGPLKLRMKDYTPGAEVDASSPYTAWKRLQQTPGEVQPIGVGDALESDAGALLVCRYVGFEEAEWLQPEAAPPPAVTEPPSPPVRLH